MSIKQYPIGFGADALIYAKSVALIGVSGNPNKKSVVGGTAVLNNLVRFGYKGKIYPINPKYDEISGQKCYASIEDVPEKVDLVVIAVAAPSVPDTVESCGRAGARSAIIITSGFAELMGMGITAENVAELKGITRREMDEFSAKSHQKAAAAQEKGYLNRSIIPITVKDSEGNEILADKDQGIRPESTADSLAQLKPCFKDDGIVTAASSSQTDDAAAFVVLMNRKKAEEKGLKPIARLIGFATAGCAPETMGLGPIYAVPKVMKLTGMTVDDMDVIELNEAFAAQAIPCIRELKMDPEKVNPWGGAIAMQITKNDLERDPGLIKAVGSVMPMTEVRIVGENGRDVKPGETGEALVRSPMVFKGYLKKKNKTVAALSNDGWFRTGDIMNPFESNYPGTKYKGPFTTDTQTTMSCAFNISNAIVNRKCTKKGQQIFDDRRILDLVDKVTVVDDEQYPIICGKIIFQMKDGRVLEKEMVITPEYYNLTWDENEEMMYRIHGEVGIPQEKTKAMLDIVKNLETTNDIKALIEAVRRP